MRLLFITQKLHGQDAFGVFWIREFRRQGFEVTVLCLEGSDTSFEFPVHTLEKEQGASRLRSIFLFEQKICSLHYDRAFIHMAPVWYALGCWYWLLRRIPCYLWYTHYQMQLGVRLFGWFGQQFFCATAQSLPQYHHSPKKIVLGHGIDLTLWPQRPNVCTDPHRLLVVHRLSRSKRLEFILGALALLPSTYTLDIYGIEAEKDYAEEMKQLTQTLQLSDRVVFHGSIPMTELPSVYAQHRFLLNMASETIDKTMLEAMTCGCYPVTTQGNAQAIGIAEAPFSDAPEAIASFIETHLHVSYKADDLYQIVSSRHSLHQLVASMSDFIRSGRG